MAVGRPSEDGVAVVVVVVVVGSGAGPPTTHRSVTILSSSMKSGQCVEIRRARGWIRVEEEI